ncbi:hypothetical protein EW026_g2531 [Hermanssonia centrifuga]|uniref:Uncharacterized protein n=1 Tax=Hermanssonia centrifuga TaxID=98765 RepID=A0A4S4KMZ4_9APHY|nr:hypothetical protein EW026_g2531 [Hermanssonia centrifuga]
MNTNTGTAQTYEAGDQRTHKSTAQGRFEAGPANAHDLHDPKDQRSLSNRAALEVKQDIEEDASESGRAGPTGPAKSHGNKPSRGAEIDAELQRDDEQRLKEKGISSS